MASACVALMLGADAVAQAPDRPAEPLAEPCRRHSPGCTREPRPRRGHLRLPVDDGARAQRVPGAAACSGERRGTEPDSQGASRAHAVACPGTWSHLVGTENRWRIGPVGRPSRGHSGWEIGGCERCQRCSPVHRSALLRRTGLGGKDESQHLRSDDPRGRRRNDNECGAGTDRGSGAATDAAADPAADARAGTATDATAYAAAEPAANAAADTATDPAANPAADTRAGAAADAAALTAASATADAAADPPADPAADARTVTGPDAVTESGGPRTGRGTRRRTGCG